MCLLDVVKRDTQKVWARGAFDRNWIRRLMMRCRWLEGGSFYDGSSSAGFPSCVSVVLLLYQHIVLVNK